MPAWLRPCPPGRSGMEKESGMRKPKKVWTRLGLVAVAALALFLAAAAALGPALAVASGTAAFEAVAPDGTRITVSAPEGTFAEGTTLSVRVAGAQSCTSALDAASADHDGAVAYELVWSDAQGMPVEPATAACSVTIELAAGVLPQDADSSSCAVRMVVDGKASGAHALAGGSSATFEAAPRGTLVVTYLNRAEEEPAVAEELPASAAAEEELLSAEPEAASEETAESAAESAAEAADPAAEEAAPSADETAKASSSAEASSEGAAAAETDASEKSSDKTAPAGEPAATTDAPSAQDATEEPSAAEDGTASETTPEEEGAGLVDSADETGSADPGTSAAEDTAAIAALAAAPASRVATVRVYLYIYLDSLPQEVQNHLSWHTVKNNTTWVTVGYIDVPTSVLPAALKDDIGSRYIFKTGDRAYEPRIAVGSSVKYSITYFTPNYGNASGIRVDQNAYYQQIAAYINWNQLGLVTDAGADGYPEAGTRPTWHLDGYYTYSEKTLNIVKSVTGNFGDKDRKYSFTASCTRPDGSSESMSFDLADGESRLITVPTGTSITVTEESYAGDGYATTVTEGGSTAAARTWSTSSLADNTTVTFTNHREIVPDVGADLAQAPYIAILAVALAAGALFLHSHRVRG